jgi:FkbH-like protein
MKLIEALEILKADRAPKERDFTVSLVCGFTPLHLETLFSAQLRLLFPDHRTQIRTGVYGDFAGNLERLITSDVDAGVLVLEWSDLDARLGLRSLGSWNPSAFPDILSNAEAKASQIQFVAEEVVRDLPVVMCLPTLPLPPISFTPGWQAGSFEAELRACVASLGIWASSIPRVRLVNPQELDRLSPLEARLDVKSEILSGFPYKLPHAAILADLLSRLVCHSPPKKGLITDLDDTLWKGTLGEIGPSEVHWDAEHQSQMHGIYQRLLHALSAEGVLIAVASKNEVGLVEQVFRDREPVLPFKAIFPLEVHWGAKSESVTRILRAWNIGAESVAFVDDNPMELAEVKAVHPEIECIHFPKNNYEGIYEVLQRLRNMFGKGTLSQEDTIRLDSVRTSHRLNIDMMNGTNAQESFLAQADGELTFNYRKKAVDSRALELVNKTNQFNLNGKRHTESSWRAYLDRYDTFLLLASYEDKYGPIGKIAVLAGRIQSRKLFLETWVMSCRAFSRRIEYQCLEALYAEYGVDEIAFDFIPTTRNNPIRRFLEEVLGAQPQPNRCLSRQLFCERCPNTFHRIRRLTSE